MHQRRKLRFFSFDDLAFRHDSEDIVHLCQAVVLHGIVASEIKFGHQLGSCRICDFFLYEYFAPAETGKIQSLRRIISFFVMLHRASCHPASLFASQFRGNRTTDESGVNIQGFGIQVRNSAKIAKFSNFPDGVQIIFDALVRVCFFEVIEFVIDFRSFIKVIKE